MEPNPNTAAGFPRAVGFYFGVRMILLVLGVRILGSDAQTSVGITLAINFILWGIAALGRSDKASARNIVELVPVRWALLFLVFTGASLAWTVAVSRAAAAAYWCGMAADASIVLFLLSQGSSHRQALSIMRGFVLGACCVAAIVWLLPSQSDLRLGDEELLGPNQLGFLFAFALFFAVFLLREGISTYRPAALFLAVSLLRSLSKTSIIACAAAFAWLLVRDRSVGWKTKIALSLLAIFVLILFSNLLLAYVDVYSDLGNQSVTLSGRFTIWLYVLNEAVEHPWIGHGFHSMWKVIPPLNGDFEPRHAHNELLQQFYAYGIAGIALLVGIYGSFYRQVRKLGNLPLRASFSALLIFILLRGLTDTEVFDLSLPMWAVILLSVFMRDTENLPGEAASTSLSQNWSATPLVTG